jgi:hypothetical protein
MLDGDRKFPDSLSVTIMENVKIFLMMLIAVGVVVNIIGWTDYWRSRSRKGSHR